MHHRGVCFSISSATSVVIHRSSTGFKLRKQASTDVSGRGDNKTSVQLRGTSDGSKAIHTCTVYKWLECIAQAIALDCQSCTNGGKW